MGANRPPSEGVECRLGSSIIETASPKPGLESEGHRGGAGALLGAGPRSGWRRSASQHGPDSAAGGVSG